MVKNCSMHTSVHRLEKVVRLKKKYPSLNVEEIYDTLEEQDAQTVFLYLLRAYKETVIIPNVNRLSKQEKYILELTEPSFVYGKCLSWCVAEKFNILGSDFPELGSRFHKYKHGKNLTREHRASFSRSIRHLKARGLLIEAKVKGEPYYVARSLFDKHYKKRSRFSAQIPLSAARH